MTKPLSRPGAVRRTVEALKNPHIGTITSITQSEDEDRKGAVVRVELRHGPKPKRNKDGMTTGPWPETSTVHVHPNEVSALKVGQQVQVRLHPAGQDTDEEEE